MSGNTAILEKFLTHSNEIKGKKLFFSFSDELFVALYGASENVIRMLTNEIDQICVCELAWNFMLAPVLSEEKIVKCQQIVYKQIADCIQRLTKGELFKKISKFPLVILRSATLHSACLTETARVGVPNRTTF